MSRKTDARATQKFITPDTPMWPTTCRATHADGICEGTNGSVWLYRSVPMSAIAEAKTTSDMMHGGNVLSNIAHEIAASTPVRPGGRRGSKSNYRSVHILALNIPTLFRPDPGPLNRFLANYFPNELQYRRVLLYGVQLLPSIIGKGKTFKDKALATLDSIVDTFTSGESTPLEDYAADIERVSAMMQRAGLVTPTQSDMTLANSWFTLGGASDVPMIHHAGHTHLFSTNAALREAKLSPDITDCSTWPKIDGEAALTFTTVSEFAYKGRTPDDPSSLWGSHLMSMDAVAISIRGTIEPPQVTSAELSRQRKKNREDIEARANAGKLDHAGQEQRQGELDQIEGIYQQGGGPPTLVNASVIVAFDGEISDPETLSRSIVPQLHTMQYRQQQALYESMLCSPVSGNPQLHDLPMSCVAYAGLSSLSRVGDKDGALLGFTEMDRQPSYASPVAASRADGTPIFLVPGSTGSGKTMVMQWMSQQFARLGSPVIIIDPKETSDLSGPVLAAGGMVHSLDTLIGADGVFDPFRFAADPEFGVDPAADMLMGVNPWGPDKGKYETPLTVALNYGLVHGATTTGQALIIAKDAGRAPAEMVDAVIDLAQSSPMFRACCGLSPNAPSLRASNGITLIKVGNNRLNLPDASNMSEATLVQRVCLTLVRMMVLGSASAVAQRRGVVMLDEAWVFLSAGQREVDQLGRVARSQDVLPILFTQKTNDALEAKLSGYISRGLILPQTDEEEAYAALKLFKIEPTPERMERLLGKATKASESGDDGTAPNWESMRALRHPDTGEVVRGTIGLYVDLAERAIPVEIRIPPQFLADMSTNPEDVRRRREAMELAQEREGQAA